MELRITANIMLRAMELRITANTMLRAMEQRAQSHREFRILEHTVRNTRAEPQSVWARLHAPRTPSLQEFRITARTSETKDQSHRELRISANTIRCTTASSEKQNHRKYNQKHKLRATWSPESQQIPSETAAQS
jgi:hypothetical protein